MKNFFNSVRKSGPLRTKDNFIITSSMVDMNGQLSIWSLMQLLNEVKGRRMNQLLLNVRFEDKVKNMDLKIYHNAGLKEELVVEMLTCSMVQHLDLDTDHFFCRVRQRASNTLTISPFRGTRRLHV